MTLLMRSVIGSPGLWRRDHAAGNLGPCQMLRKLLGKQKHVDGGGV
jgi:hypothetical protein